MALNNCIIVNSDGVEGSVSVTALDAVNNIANQFLYIKPNEGYVVSASDFSHGTLDTNITSIGFTDTTSAGALGAPTGAVSQSSRACALATAAGAAA